MKRKESNNEEDNQSDKGNQSKDDGSSFEMIDENDVNETVNEPKKNKKSQLFKDLTESYECLS